MLKIMLNIIRIVLGFPLLCILMIVPYTIIFLVQGIDEANENSLELWNQYKRGF